MKPLIADFVRSWKLARSSKFLSWFILSNLLITFKTASPSLPSLTLFYFLLSSDLPSHSDILYILLNYLFSIFPFPPLKSKLHGDRNFYLFGSLLYPQHLEWDQTQKLKDYLMNKWMNKYYLRSFINRLSSTTAYALLLPTQLLHVDQGFWIISPTQALHSSICVI